MTNKWKTTMSQTAIAKWKTFPCKNCLIKNVCGKYCFHFPPYNEMNIYVKENKYIYICLGCGRDHSNDHTDIKYPISYPKCPCCWAIWRNAKE